MDLKKILAIFVGIDVIWAVLMATFGTTLLTQIGGIGELGSTATVTGGILGWLILFVAALWQGAIFLLVFSVFGAIGSFIYSNLPEILQKVVKIALLANLAWAGLVATFGASLVGGLGTVPGASELAAKVGAFTGWIIMFIAAYLQGLVFLFVGAGFGLVLLLLYIVLTKKPD